MAKLYTNIHNFFAKFSKLYYKATLQLSHPFRLSILFTPVCVLYNNTGPPLPEHRWSGGDVTDLPRDYCNKPLEGLSLQSGDLQTF